MKLSFTCVAVDLKRGGLVPLVVGQPDDHIMDWRGCNFHRVALPGWRAGRRLPDTERNRLVLKALLWSIDDAKLQHAVRHKVGQFYGDHDKRYDMVL